MRRTFVCCLAVASLAGCVREVEIENQPAEVTSVGALSVDANQNVIIGFSIRDFEGDDQLISVDICDAPGDNCGVAEVAVGGDPLDRVPAVPKNTDVFHEFRWAAWCGRWLDQELVPSAPDDEFVVAVSVLPSMSDPVYSEPSSLAALGAVDGACE